MRTILIFLFVILAVPMQVLACADGAVFAVSIVERNPKFKHNILKIGESVKLEETNITCRLDTPKINRKAIEKDPRIKFSTSIRLSCSTSNAITLDSFATWERYSDNRTYLTQSADDTFAGISIKSEKRTYELAIFCL